MSKGVLVVNSLAVNDIITTETFAVALASLKLPAFIPQIACAVSGGCDSMALCLLMQDYLKPRDGRVVALTVDHGIRAESTGEAAQTQAWLRAHGIEHHILRWKREGVLTGNLQAQARHARYRLMQEWCHARHIPFLATAHHHGDQLETLLLRRARGSGDEGLSGMSSLRRAENTLIIRPLLSFRKPQLHATLQAYNQPWIEDPSNASELFDRVRARKTLEQADAKSIATLEHEIAAHKQARIEMEERVAYLLARYCKLHPFGFVTMTWPDDVHTLGYTLPRALLAMIQTISGMDRAPRYAELERLTHALLAAEKPLKRTLGGCQLEFRPDMKRLRIWREPAAAARYILPVSALPARWDGRFAIEPPSALSGQDNLYIRALGTGGVAKLGKEALKPFKSLPKAVFYTLPALWHLDELLAVPHMQQECTRFTKCPVTAVFQPMKALAAMRFW